MSAWYEIIVTGSEDALRGFVAGCEAALGGTEAAVFGHDLDLEPARFSQRLRDFFAAGSHHHVFAPSGLTVGLVAALRKRGRETDLGLAEVREIVRARMRFAAEAFSREVAGRIRQELLAALPPGVEGENIDQSETWDPSANGAELYTPEHAYVYRVSGTFVGPLPGIIEMRRRAGDLAFVRVQPPELETRPAEDLERTNG